MNTGRIGVVVGRGKERDHLEMVISFSERERSPKLGSFLVLEEQEFMNRKFLARVEDMNYGDFQATKDDRIRAIVEKYMREIAGHGRELSDEEKRTLFFRHYILKILGTMEKNEIVTEYRLLPELSTICRVPTEEEYSVITNAGIQDKSKAFEVGNLVIGKEPEEHNILFEPWKFENRRTAILARTGYGKSNLCKVVVSLASLIGKTGILVLDMDGEYAFKTKAATGQEVPGLADLQAVKANLVVYSQRKSTATYEDVYVAPLMNFELLGPFHVAELCPDQDLKILPEFKYSGFTKPDEWPRFLADYRQMSSVREQQSLLLKYCEGVKGQQGGDKRQAFALRRNLRSILQFDNPEAPNILEDVKFHLAQNRLVVIDFSLLTLEVAYRIASLILDELFNHNMERITTGALINTIAVFEESQNVLNRRAVEEGTSVFTRWAKEGRKFHLGLVYVTQQPGAIAEEIVSQTDNYFVMHLLNKGDTDALRKANPHYDGIIADFLTTETFIGNTYIYSAPLQPYVFPAKVKEFGEEFIRSLSGREAKYQSPLLQLQEMAEFLTPKLMSNFKSWQSFIGKCSYEIYNYFAERKIPMLLADHGLKRLDYSVAENIVTVMIRRKLLSEPKLNTAEKDGE